MNEADVLDFLKNNPEFLLANAKSLGVQLNNDKITAFAEVKLQANEIRTQRMEQHLNDIIDNARHNQVLIETLFQLDNALIAATNLEAIFAALDDALNNGFGLPHYALRLAPQKGFEITANRLLDPNSSAYEKFSQLSHSHCDHYLADDVLTWLPNSTATLQSFLKVPLLSPSLGFIGVLIVASPNPQHFTPEQDTSYMDNLAQNLSTGLNRILTTATA